jgi:hypothetical protein
LAHPLLLFLSLGFHPTFSRHGNIKTSFYCSFGLTKTLDFIRPFLAMAILNKFLLLIWLNENVGFHLTFSRHGNIKQVFIAHLA